MKVTHAYRTYAEPRGDEVTLGPHVGCERTRKMGSSMGLW